MPAVSEEEAADILQVEGFDLEKAKNLIAMAPIGDAAKETVSTALEQAQNNPVLLGAVLEKARTLLGL
jgi:hypothetical protein